MPSNEGFLAPLFCPALLLSIVTNAASVGLSSSSLRGSLLLSQSLRSRDGWPDRASWDQLFTNVTTVAEQGNKSACMAPLLGRARLKPDGLGSRLNQFANELVDAMYVGKPIALCAPPDVRDTWSIYFQDPGFARCQSCDYRGRNPADTWIAGWRISRDHDHAEVDELKRFLYGKLFRLSSDMQELVEDTCQTLGLSNEPYIGVHIRRGDKANEAALVAVDQYVSEVQKMHSQLGASKVFLASDDSDTLGQLQERLGPSFSVVQQSRLPAEDYKIRGEFARQTMSLVTLGKVSDSEKNLLVDISLLIHASAFIGTATSNIGRLVYFLRDPTTPAVSLDDGGSFLNNPGF